MLIRNTVLGLLAAVLVFQSMGYMDLISKRVALDSADYTFAARNVGIFNRGAVLRDEGSGVFYIHTGEREAPTAILTFTRDLEVTLDFSIRNSGRPGEIQFTTLSNDGVVSDVVVASQDWERVRLNVERGDKLRIVADKHGSTDADHGAVRVTVSDFTLRLQAFLIPALWTMLLILLISRNYLYVGLGSYLLFLLAVYAEKLNYGSVSFDVVFGYTALLFSITFLLVLLYQEAAKRVRPAAVAGLVSLVVVLAAFVPVNFIVYCLSFQTPITQEILYAVLQSNQDEALEYVRDFYALRYVFMGLVVLMAMGVTFFLQKTRKVVPFERLLLIFLLLAFSSLAITQRDALRVPMLVFKAYEDYHHELNAFSKALAQRQTQAFDFVSTKKARGETYIVVLGESLSKKHMSLYGYPRDTTPRLSELFRKGDLLRFDNAYSNHTHTTLVMQLSLTEASQYNDKNYVESVSLLEVLNKAGVETHWLTNQVIYGPFDTITSVIASSADNLVSLNRTIGRTTAAQVYDEALIAEVEKVLATPGDNNRVIFVHLIGNHSIYSSRYPQPGYSRFEGPVDQGLLGEKAAASEKLNSYDNSVLYNDFVVSAILEALKKQGGTTGFIYTADHGEDVIGDVGHLSTQFNFDMTKIPLLAWFSEGYQAAYPDKYATLKANQSTLFSNDMLHDTVLGVTGVASSRYTAAYDFSSGDYALEPENAAVLSSNLRYVSERNTAYWQSKNAQYLVDTDQAARVFPHRINSIAKLQEIWRDGLRSFEVDVRFGDDQQPTFRVGHHPGVMGEGLERFLQSVDYSQIERLWLDFKNLNTKNYAAALERLAYLDGKYGLKSKAIVESGTAGSFFQILRAAGWHTSYYLPTRKIADLQISGDAQALEQLASDIAQQVSAQNVNAVSFDTRIYPFVEQYLEGGLASDVNYHVWYGPDLADTDFQKTLQENKLANNRRVKTLLVKYDSQFHL